VVSVWEAIVKYQLGKLSLPQSSGTYLPAQRERHGIASLELDETSVAMLHILPSIYRDPFDRIMICHTLSGALTLVTTDAIVKAYSVPTLDG
jgi:PIN domain nuclease of toxin-antitoxin system